MSRRKVYRVERHTGAAWCGNGVVAKSFTTSATVRTIREARKVARRLLVDRPLYDVRIVRDERNETVVEVLAAKEARP